MQQSNRRPRPHLKAVAREVRREELRVDLVVDLLEAEHVGLGMMDNDVMMMVMV